MALSFFRALTEVTNKEKINTGSAGGAEVPQFTFNKMCSHLLNSILTVLQADFLRCKWFLNISYNISSKTPITSEHPSPTFNNTRRKQKRRQHRERRRHFLMFVPLPTISLSLKCPMSFSHHGSLALRTPFWLACGSWELHSLVLVDLYRFTSCCSHYPRWASPMSNCPAPPWLLCWSLCTHRASLYLIAFITNP